MFNSLFEFFGNDLNKDIFLDPKMPPCVFLLPREKEKLFYALTELNQSTEASEVKLKAKLLLTKIFFESIYKTKKGFQTHIQNIYPWRISCLSIAD